MSRQNILVIALILVGFVLGAPASAQWPDDPALNFSVADGQGEQVLPKIASTSDGGCYVGWFDNRNGAYEVYLQRLDALGIEQWAHNGILISDHPQLSSLVDWDLIVDTGDAAVLVFTDARDGTDLDVFAYRIGMDGLFLWGPDGLALSTNDDYEPAPVVTQASDGDCVFIWPRLPDAGGGSLMMQRVTPSGVELLPAGGLPVLSPGTEKPAFVKVVPAENGLVICSYVRDIATFFSPRHVRAAKFAADGSVAWGPVAVYDATSIPIAHVPRLAADGMGGAVLGWHVAPGSIFNAYVQHLDAAGAESWPHNGVAVSTSASTSQLDPSLAYNTGTGETFVAWNERNSGQSQWGIYAQKIDASGARVWNATGEVLVPVDTVYKSYPHAAPLGDGCVVFFADEPGGMFNQDRLLGVRLDGDGNQVWPGSPILVSSYLSSKSRRPLTITPDGTALMVWEDDREGTPDIYGQNVNADGSLGPQIVAIEESGDPAAPASDLPGTFAVHACYPNPFNPLTTIRFDLPERAQVRLRVHDAAGRAIRTLVDGPLPAAHHRVVWDGTDAAGRRQPSGVYYYRLDAGEHTASRTMTLVK